MKPKLIRCGICLDWHNPSHHCGNCGAYHVMLGRKVTHYNVHGVEVVRGIPLPLHQTIKLQYEN